MNRDSFGGAWCPKNTISPGVREWLEVDLGSRPYRIRRTGTQGRFGGGRGQEFAELFTLEYWREGMADGAWVSYKNHTGNEVSKIAFGRRLGKGKGFHNITLGRSKVSGTLYHATHAKSM